MRYSISTRLLSLILAAALLIPCIPQGSATANEPNVPVATEAAEIAETTEVTEATEATEVPDAAKETEATEVTEPAEETEATEVTEPAEETEATEVTEPAEETEATEATEPAEETEVTEATEPVEETEATEATEPVEETSLPHGFLGMPKDYQLSEENQKKRAAMEEHNVLETMSGLIPGKNYAKNQIMVSAETEEEALLIAQAYCGELTDFGYGIALITLTEATALEAVEASMDESLNLPVASPNYTYSIDPIVSEPASTFSFNAPTRQTWNDWIHDTLGDAADPALLYPYEYNYQYMHDVVDSYAAWGVNTGEERINVAVIDSGVDAGHEDLYNVTTYDVGLGTSDVNGHGTHVAGIIAAALGNARGGAGIAPNVSIMGYCTGYSDGGIDTYYEILAIYHAVEHGAHVINMSLGGYWYDYYEDMAVQYAYEEGVTVVAAMGNDGSNTINYPAAYDHVIAVAATDRSNNRAYYSNYGDWCDISAPGSGIYSTLPGDDYEAWDGTSMATPVVTGAIALYMSHWGGNPGPDHIQKVLKASAVKCKDKGMGAGIVNIANMLDDKPDAPAYSFTYNGSKFLDFGEKYSGSVLPCETQVRFATYGYDESWFILYTLDGKTPSVKNGEVVIGERFLGSDHPIDLTPYAGSTVTLKAMQVSGLGLPGKVLTLKLKVADSIQVTGVSIEGPARMAAGKKGQFVATVYPSDKADQDVVWSIESPSHRTDIKIDKTGKLTTPKNYSGTITVKATSVADARYYDTASVEVSIVNPVSKMALNMKTASLYVGQYVNLDITQLIDANGWSIPQEYAGIQWSSSNTKVATVDEYGYVTALSKGKATIICKALDGSNKSAKCTVTVKQQVESIEISGPATAAIGANVTLKATVSPSTANTKAVSWSVISYTPGVSISSAGKLKIESWVAPGTSILVQAVSKDGFAASTYELTVQKKLTALKITEYNQYGGWAAGAVYNSKGVLTTMNLFSVDMVDSAYRDNFCDLWYAWSGPDSLYVEWTSSNPAVASVDRGYVTAHKAGTAKITCKALDGSNKSASITVKVTNPVSYMEIKTSAPQMTNYTPYVGIGKSVTNTVTFGNTYGKPANTKVVWDFYAYEVNPYGEEVYRYNWNDFFHNNNLITIKNGKLTVKKDVYEYWKEYCGYVENVGCNEFMIDVRAYSMDGTYTMASKTFLVIPLTTTMKMEYKTYHVYGNDGGIADFYSDQWHLFENYYESGFTATSSNPKVASVIGIYPYEDSYYVYKDWYSCYFATGKPGKATITIKATDGSNKSCSFTVRVY